MNTNFKVAIGVAGVAIFLLLGVAIVYWAEDQRVMKQQCIMRCEQRFENKPAIPKALEKAIKEKCDSHPRTACRSTEELLRMSLE